MVEKNKIPKLIIKFVAWELVLLFLVLFIGKLKQEKLDFYNHLLDWESGHFVIYRLDSLIEYGLQYLMFLLPFPFLSNILVYNLKSKKQNNLKSQKTLTALIIILTTVLLGITLVFNSFVASWDYSDMSTALNDFGAAKESVQSFYRFTAPCLMIIHILFVFSILLPLRHLRDKNNKELRKKHE